MLGDKTKKRGARTEWVSRLFSAKILRMAAKKAVIVEITRNSTIGSVANVLTLSIRRPRLGGKHIMESINDAREPGRTQAVMS